MKKVIATVALLLASLSASAITLPLRCELYDDSAERLSKMEYTVIVRSQQVHVYGIGYTWLIEYRNKETGNVAAFVITEDSLCLVYEYATKPTGEAV